MTDFKVVGENSLKPVLHFETVADLMALVNDCNHVLEVGQLRINANGFNGAFGQVGLLNALILMSWGITSPSATSNY